MTRLSDNIGSILMEVEILTYTYIRNIENDNLNSSILCETLQVLRQQMDHIKHEANKVKAQLNGKFDMKDLVLNKMI